MGHKLRRQIEEEGVNYITCALSVLDRIAEDQRLDPELLNPDEALELVENLIIENSKMRVSIECLRKAIAETLTEEQGLKLTRRSCRLMREIRDEG